MKDTRFRIYYLLACLGVLIASVYPLSMGIRVITDIIDDGTVYKGNYPKYIIPYFPICIAIIAGVLLMPLLFKIFKRFAFAAAASAATGLFFAAELLLEKKVVVSASESLLTLEDWQMYMCYIPPYDASNIGNVSYRPLTAVEILMGDYNPAFKLHFYIISVILIITILNSLYGFGHIAKTGDRQRLCPLIIQSVCSFSFLGLCILACFTAFWRDGSVLVSPLSAVLMTLFFVLLGVTAGVFTGSFLLKKQSVVLKLVPSVTASAMTLLMYIGEMILLNGHLYSLGTGALFTSLPKIVLSFVDIAVIAVSGGITALIFAFIRRRLPHPESR